MTDTAPLPKDQDPALIQLIARAQMPKAEAVLAALDEAGYVIVPRELTYRMVYAGHDELQRLVDAPSIISHGAWGMMSKIWQAMIAAAAGESHDYLPGLRGSMTDTAPLPKDQDPALIQLLAAVAEAWSEFMSAAEAAIAAIAAIEKPGYVLVPREPTDRIALAACLSPLGINNAADEAAAISVGAKIWRAMIAAALGKHP